MIREGIELGSLKGLAQNKTSGWFIMLLVFKPLREILLLASNLLRKLNKKQRPRTPWSIMIWKTGGMPFSFEFSPQARNLACFVVEFREVFQLFPVRGDTPEVPGRVDWFLMGPRNVIRAGRKKGDQFCCKTWYARKRRNPRNSRVLMLDPFFGGSNLTLKSMVISMNFPQRWCIVWVIVWEWPL